MKYLIFIPMTPRPKERARVCRGHSFTPKNTVVAEKKVKQAWIDAGITPAPLTGPLSMYMTFVFLRPKSRVKLNEKYHTVRPDCDNLQKLICDSLNGVAYVDDGQVCDIHATKVYTDDPTQEGVHICITSLDWAIGNAGEMVTKFF